MQCSNINKSLCHTWRLKRHSDVWVVSVKASCQLAWAAGKTHYVGRWNAACTLRYVAVAPGRPTSTDTCLFKIDYKILPRVGVVILNQKNLYFLFFNKTLLRQGFSLKKMKRGVGGGSWKKGRKWVEVLCTRPPIEIVSITSSHRIPKLLLF